MQSRHALLTAAGALAGALTMTVALTVPVSAAPPPGKGTPVTVMTRNVYLGGDITRPLRETAGITDPGALVVALANSNDGLAAVVDQTDFPARSRLLAREIAEQKPDLVGLQEVATWRHGPLQLPPPTDAFGRVIANATTVDYDFLQLLLGALRAAGTPYDVVHVQQASDVEGPAFSGNLFAGTAVNPRDVRLTMHDVVLKRAGSAVRVEHSGGAQYDTRLAFSLGGLTYEFVRGYAWADVRVGAKRLRFVNTHLESQYSVFALGQAQELLAEAVGPAAAQGLPVVVVCDCNSDPLDGSQKDLPTPPGGKDVPHWQPYRLLTSVLSDAWLASGTSDPGYTSGLDELVQEAPPASFTHRIDLVLTLGAGGTAVPADQPAIVGSDPANRTAGGLWPSDHAGVVVRLRP